jgi:hypothetical protein
MRITIVTLGVVGCLAGLTLEAPAQNKEPQPQDATAAVLRAFDDHHIVMFGETHGCKQEYEWLQKLVSTPEFADRVNDIVVEIGNSLYQKTVDRYIAGEDVPLEELQLAWRNVVGAIGVSPVQESLYRAVREANLKRKGKKPMRIVLGGPPADWDKIKDRSDLDPFTKGMARDQFYARQVIEESIKKKRRAFLIMGGLHFQRMTRRTCRGAGTHETGRPKLHRKTTARSRRQHLRDPLWYELHWQFR